MAKRVTTKEVIVRYKADTSDFTKALKSLDKSAAQSARSLQKLERGFTTMFQVARNATVLYYMSKNLIELGKAFTTAVDAVKSFRLQAEGLSQSTTGFDEMFMAAQDTRIALSDMGKQVNIFTPALQKMGVTFKGSLKFIENLTKSMRLYGVQGEAARNSTIQLAQAFSSGRLQGDELRSMSENAGGLYAKLEDVIQGMLGTTTGLRDLGTEGKITSDVLYAAFDQLFDDVGERFVELPTTVSQMADVVTNEFTLLAYALNERFQISDAIVDVLEALAEGAKVLRLAVGDYTALNLAETLAEEREVAAELVEAERELIEVKGRLAERAEHTATAMENEDAVADILRLRVISLTNEVETLEDRKFKLADQAEKTAVAVQNTGDAAISAGDAMSSATADAQAFADAMVNVAVSTNNALAELAAFRRGGLAALKVQKLIGAEEAYAAKNASLPEAERNKLMDEYRTGVIAEQQLQSEIAAARAAARSGGGGGGGGRARRGGGGGGGGGTSDAQRQAEAEAKRLQNLLDKAEPVSKLVRDLNDDMAFLGEQLGVNSERFKEVSVALGEDYVDAIDRVIAKDLPEEIEKQASVFKDLYDAMSDDFASALVDVANGTDSWSEAVDGLAEALGKAIIELLIIKPLMAGISSGLGSVFPGLGFGSTQGRATGGPVMGGQSYMVGESGPEMFTPHSSGQISKGGGINVTVNTLPGTSAEVREDQGGLTIDIVDMHIAASFAAGGNMISRAAETAYPGLRRGLG